MAITGYGYAATRKRKAPDEQTYCAIPMDPADARSYAEDCFTLWYQRDMRMLPKRY